jgi:hypothetical protein
VTRFPCRSCQVRVWFHNRRHREKCKSRDEPGSSAAQPQQSSKLLDEGPIVQWLGRLAQSRQQSAAGFGAQLATPLAGAHASMPPSWCSGIPLPPYSCPSGCPVAFDPSAALALPPFPSATAMPAHPGMWPSPYMGAGPGCWTGFAHGYAAPYSPHVPPPSFGLSPYAAFPAYPAPMNHPGAGMVKQPYMMNYGHGLPSYGQSSLSQGGFHGGSSSQALPPGCTNMLPAPNILAAPNMLPTPNVLPAPMATLSCSPPPTSTAGAEPLRTFGGTRGRDGDEATHRDVRPRH